MEMHQRPKRLASLLTALQINCTKIFIAVNNGQTESFQFENAQKPNHDTVCETWYVED